MSRAAHTVDHSTYRPDIDGLRAIAVLAVVAFHVNPAWLPGGFAGVDVFFVISGYLITANLWAALKPVDGAGHPSLAVPAFSYGAFLAGRVRRLAPALLAMLAATLVAAQWLMRPEDARTVAASALWSLASAANLYFWQFGEHGYFDAPSAEQPLLHLWSLGVEEQFYLVWPLLLAWIAVPLARRIGALAAPALAFTLAGASFWLGWAYATDDPSFAYYTLPTRASGLLLGATLALLAARFPRGLPLPERLGRPLAEVLALSGMTLLAGSGITWVTEADPYPGIAVLWPSLGTALLIAAGLRRAGAGTGSPTFTAWLLGSLPMVAIGRVSYAAYLWHWPLLAFYRYGHGAPDTTTGLVLFALTFVLAALSTWLLETPIRRRRATPLRTAGELLLLPGTVLAAAATLLFVTQGFGVRQWSPAYMAAWQQVGAQTRPAVVDPAVCQRERLTAADLRDPRCVSGTPGSSPPEVLLWGDSHAAHYVRTLSLLAERAGFRVRNATHSGCPPVLGDPAGLIGRDGLADCRASLRAVEAELPNYRAVILAASWYSYQYRSPTFKARFTTTLQALRARGIRVLLVGRVPLMLGYDRLCEEKAIGYPGLACRDVRVAIQPAVKNFNDWLRSTAAGMPGVAYYDANAYLCPDGVCRLRNARGELLYFDHNHLSTAGSIALGHAILRAEGVPSSMRTLAANPG